MRPRSRRIALAVAACASLTCTDSPSSPALESPPTPSADLVELPGLVARWTFHEGSGTTAADSAGSNTGTLVNGPLWVPGRVGSGLSFDGANDYVQVADHASLDVTANLTITAWINPRGLGQNSQGRIIDKASEDGTVGYLFRLNSSNRIGFQQHGQTGGVNSANDAIALNTWQHVAAVVSGGTSVTLYVNGVNVGGGTLTGPIAANTKPLRIGTRHDGNRMFDGSIDEVRIYGRALTGGEVATIHDLEANGPPPPPPPAIVLWADPPVVVAGGSSTLRWSATNTVSCSSDGWTTLTAATGAQAVTPAVNTVFTLTCAGPGGSTAVSASVNVVPPFVGRIAYSTDGNLNDPDDWFASPTTLAIIERFGATSRLVHLDYNSILCSTDPVMQAENRTSVLGGASRFGGIAPAILFDDQLNAAGGRTSLAAAISASDPSDPLYIIVAGPIQAVYDGVSLADHSKLPYVWIISHHPWNDGYHPGSACNDITSRDLIDLGVNWVQLRDQNGDCGSVDPAQPGLCTSPINRPATQAEFAPWSWLQTAADPELNWLHERMLISQHADASDAGMTYFLFTGDEFGTVDDLESLLADNTSPPVVSARPSILLEVENFQALSNYVVQTGTVTSHAGKVLLAAGASSGTIRTRFNELHSADGTYDVHVRYFDDSSPSNAVFTLRVNGVQQGASWSGTLNDNSWRTATRGGVAVRKGDEISIEGTAASGDFAEIDNVELVLTGPAPPPPPAPTVALSATPPAIIAGGSSTLTWSATNANVCTADGWTTATTTSGAQIVTPIATTTYTITCGGPGGSTGASATVTVDAPGSLVYTVSHVDDSDDGLCNAVHCSLREAINSANLNVGADDIRFAIGTAAPHVIIPASPLPVITGPVTIDGTTDPDGVVVSGAAAGPGADGFRLNGGSSVIRGLVIQGFDGAGIRLSSSGNAVIGNSVGTNPSGTQPVPNRIGIEVDAGAGNAIGGAAPGHRNLLSGNLGDGISLKGTSSGTTIVGNFIGVDATGAVALGNGARGVRIDAVGSNRVGGTANGERNVISANGAEGVLMVGAGATLNRVEGNIVGTDAAQIGTRLGNTLSGIRITGGASANAIGGGALAARNILAANGDHGVLVDAGASGNNVRGNYIGTVDGATDVGNAKSGVYVAASGNSIGGIAPGEGNLIAFQDGDGVTVVSGTGNSISSNSIFHNHTPSEPAGVFLGIDLADDGPTPNDANDADVGPNSRQNFPLITSAISGGTIAGMLNSIPSTQFRLEFFTNTSADFDGFVCDRSGHGEGETYRGSINVTTAAGGGATFSANFGLLTPGTFVTATATDPSGSTSEFSPCFEVAGGADVSATKTGPASVDAGAQLTYTLTVVNQGPNTAAGVVAADVLPAGVTFVSASDGGTHVAGTVSWPAINLTNGQSVQRTVTVTAPATAGTLLNVARATATTPDLVTTNNDGSNAAARVSTTVTARADVGVTKAGPATVGAGAQLTYTLTAVNQGPNTATGVVVADVLPAGVTFVSASDGGTNSAGTVTWPAINLTNGQSVQRTVTVIAPASGTLTNVARATATTPDPVATNNDGSSAAARVVTTVTERADVGVTKAGPATVGAGAQLTYTLTAVNQGPSTATGVVVADVLPAGVSFVSASDGGTQSAGTVSWPALSLTNGQSVQRTVTVTAPASGTLTNVARATSTTADPVATNNDGSNAAARVSTTVTERADVVVSKSGPAVVAAGADFAYTISVVNLGPSTAMDVVLTDVLPAGVTFVSASDGGTEVAGTVSWPGLSLADGQSVQRTVTVRAPASGTLTNVARTTSTTNDPDPTNNDGSGLAARVSTTIGEVADVSVTKTGPPSVDAGASLTYTLTAVNQGPSTATGVVVADVLPAGVTFVSASDGGTNSAGTVTWPAINLTNGQSVQRTLTVIAPANGTLTNVARATATTPDPVATNNDGSSAAARVSTTIGGVADVEVTKTGPPSIDAAAQITYTLTVANQGPSTATGVVVTDVLPAGVSFVSASDGGTQSAGTVSWPALSLTNGQSVQRTVTVTAPASGTLTNVARATATTADPVATNNDGSSASARVATTVTERADVVVTKTGPATAGVGAQITYTLTVVNQGPSTAAGVVVTDVLPAGVTFVSASNGGTQSAGAVTWPALSLTNGQSLQRTVTVTAPAAAGTLTNVARATATTADPVATNNDGSNAAARVSTTVTPLSPTGLAAHWTFDEGIGTTAADAAGSNTGTLVNGPLWVAGRIDDALSFDGVNDYVQVADHSSLDITGNLTIAAWINPRSLGQNSQGRIVDKASQDGTVGYVFRVNTSNRIGLHQHNQTGGVNSANNAITFNVWQHVAVVVSGGTNVTLYVNGVNVGGGTLTGAIAANTKPLRIGIRHDGNRRFNGSIDEVRIYSRALAPTEIASLHGQGTTPPPPPTVTLTASPTSIAVGGSSTLTWSSTNATTCMSDGWTSLTATSGSVVVSPTAETTYSLTCTGPGGSETESVTVSVTIVDADVEVTKTGPPTVDAGAQLTYTLTVANQGPSTATGVVVTDVLPAGVTFVSASDGGTQAAGTVSWPALSLTNGQSVQRTVTVSAPGSGTLTNVARATATTADPVATNNDGSSAAARVSTTVTERADVVVTKAGPATVGVGAQLTYTLTVVNQGPSTAAGVVVTDVLPAGATFVSASNGGTEAAGTVTWPALSLTNGQSVQRTVTVAAPATAGTLLNVARATSTTPDFDATNNDGTNAAARVSTTVTEVADIAVTKSGPASVDAGAQMTYTLTVANDGPSAATGVVVTDVLPAGVTFVSASDGGTETAGTVSWPALSLTNGQSVQRTVTVNAPSSGPLTNVARATATTADPVATNNDGSSAAARVSTAVTELADVEVTKAGPPSVGAGEQFTYTLTVVNHGPSMATGVVAADVLPSGVTFLSASHGGTETAGTVSWPPINLANGQSAQRTVTVAAPATAGTLLNVARATATTADPVATNNDGSTGAARVSTTVTELADVTVAKSGPEAVGVGAQLTYTLTVVNQGPSTAMDVVLMDVLPAGVTFVSASDGGTEVAGTVSWPGMSLADGQSMQRTVTVTAPASGTLLNVARTTSTTSDPDPTNNDGSSLAARVSTTITEMADVDVTKTGPGSVDAGAQLTYTLTVLNRGPSTATGVVAADVLPAGATFVSASDGGSATAGTVSWPAVNLTNGQSVQRTVTVSAPASGTLTNVARATATTADPVGTNNDGSSAAAQVATTVTEVADVVVTNAGPATVGVGTQLTYTLTVLNQGPSTATGVVVADVLPAGVTFVSASEGGTNSASTVTWPSISLANGQSVQQTVTVTAPAAVGTLTNVARATAATADPVATNNDGSSASAQVATTVTEVADVEVTKSGPASVVAGAQIAYTLTVANRGPSTATGVVVTDVLPAGVTFVSASDGGADLAGSVSWPAVNLTNGQSIQRTVTVTAPASGTLTNVARATATTADPVGTNNDGSSASAQVNTTIGEAADIEVTKTGPATVDAGAQLTYTLTVVNHGPSTATGVLMTDVLPPGVTFVSASNGGTQSAGTVSWPAINLTNGQSAQRTVTVTAPASGTLSNVARATATTADPVTTNNDGSNAAAQAATTVTERADVEVTKTGAAAAGVGAQLTYTLTIVNHGPSTATGVLLTDVLPAGVTFVSASNGGTQSAGTVSWPAINITNGQSVQRTVTVTAPAAAGTLTNVAHATATTADPVATNNDGSNTAAQVATTVTERADVVVTKSGPAAVTAGADVAYTISVVNHGPSVAAGVVVADVLPAGVTFVSASDGGTPSAGTVSWPAINLASGQGVQRTVTVSAPASGTLTNVARASATTPDPNSTNNDGSSATAQVATTVSAAGSTGLSAHWTFDEGSGTTAADAAGSNTGTLLNGPLWVAGRVDDALSFDGVNDYVQVADHGSLDVTGNLTIAAWINPRSLGQNSQGRIVDKASQDGTVGYVFRMDTSNRIGFQQHGQTSGVSSAVNAVTLNAWQHVAVVLSGGTNVTLYVNGVSVGGGALTGPIAANTKPLRIGIRHDGNRMFDGSIDDVRIYGRALAPSEIASLHGQGTTPPPPPSVTLAASPTMMLPGASSTLSWNSAGATSCTASGGWSGSRFPSGSLVVSPATTTTYTLACDGSGGSNSASVAVAVVPTGAYYPPSESGGGWRSLVTLNATPTAVQKANVQAVTGIDWDQLKIARDYSESLAPSTVLVIRRGWVVGEWGSTASQGVASVTKSLTGLAMAKLMDLSDAGQLPQTIGGQSLVHQYLPPAFGASDPLKQLIRIEHLLTMSSGIEPADPDNLTQQQRLTRPMDAAPGSEWVYSSLSANLLSMILQGLSGQTLASFFNSRLAASIGASPLQWQTIDGGYTMAAAGASTSARDLARIAHLTAQGGVWDNGSGPTQVVSASQVATLVSPAALTQGITFRASPGSPFPLPSDAPNHFGRLWWTNSTRVALGPAVPPDAYYMHGCLDDLAVVVPSHDLIVVRLAESGPFCNEPSFRSGFMQRVMAALVN